MEFMIMNQQKLIEYLNKSELMYLSTCFNGKPHVRCMAMIFYEKSIWCCSKSNRLKVAEIRQNNEVETCILIESEKDFGSIRGSGKARIITSPKVRAKLADQIPFFKAYWDSPADTDFTLVKLEIAEYMFHDPDDKQFYSISFCSDEEREGVVC